MFQPRTAKPEAGNKYYIRKASGGYSTAIKGKPTDKDCDVLSNCVGYAVGRFHEIAEHPAFDLLDTVNAENLYENAKQHGLKTGSLPALGAMAVWRKGDTFAAGDGAGHAGIVEQILKGGVIVTSESGYNAQKPFWTTVRKSPYGNGEDYTLLGFIYQPAAQQAIPAGVIRRGDKGDAVRWMQTRLAAHGCLRSTEIDGDFGLITLGGLLAFQLISKLTPDGVCGPETKTALAKNT